MPRLNNLGQATTGFGVTWYDATRTLALNTITLSDGTTLDTRAANVSYAKNGRWIAFLAGYGVFGSVLPTPLPAAGLIPDPFESDYLAADGTFAYKTVYQATGPWTLVNPDGSTQLFGADPRAVQVLGASSVVWREANGLLQGLNSPVPLPSRACHWHRIVSGHLLYQDDATGALVLDGRAIGSPGNYYRPDLLVQADGSMLIVWSPTEAETTYQSITIPSALALQEAPPIETVVFVEQPAPVAPSSSPTTTQQTNPTPAPVAPIINVVAPIDNVVAPIVNFTGVLMSGIAKISDSAIVYASTKPSSVAGCVNYLDASGQVFSVQPDGSIQMRPAGTDGSFEQGKPNSSDATFTLQWTASGKAQTQIYVVVVRQD